MGGSTRAVCCSSPLVYTINNRKRCTRLFGPALLKLQLPFRQNSLRPTHLCSKAALDTAGTRFSLQKASMQCTASTHLKRVRLITLFSVLANRRCCLSNTSHMVVSMRPSCAAIAMARRLLSLELEEVQAHVTLQNCLYRLLPASLHNNMDAVYSHRTLHLMDKNSVKDFFPAARSLLKSNGTLSAIPIMKNCDTLIICTSFSPFLCLNETQLTFLCDQVFWSSARGIPGTSTRKTCETSSCLSYSIHRNTFVYLFLPAVTLPFSGYESSKVAKRSIRCPAAFD